MAARASIWLACVVTLLFVGVGSAGPANTLLSGNSVNMATQGHVEKKIVTTHQQSNQRHKYSMEIFVFTYNRLESLKRLWRSLTNATYLDMPVDVTIFMDYDANQESPVHNWLSGVQWPHGHLRIHKREVNVGLRASIEEAWYPSNPDSFGAFFEDDIEVAQDWYVWVDNAIQEYYYKAGQPPKLVGLSLFRGLWNILTREYTNWETNGTPFIFQQPQSWGQVLFPRPWRYFRSWIHFVKDPTCHGVKLASNLWRSSGTWKKYLIKMMYEDGLYMIYPNFPNQMSLSMHHMEAGVHFRRGMRDDPVWALRTLVPLLSRLAVEEWSQSGYNPLTCPPLGKLNVYDIMGNRVANTSELYNSNVKLPLGYLFPHERKNADPNIYDLGTIYRKYPEPAPQPEGAIVPPH